MPRTTIAQENRVGGTAERYPRITLTKSERGRLYCYENPWEEWTHRIEAPKIMNGEQVFTRTTDRNNNEIMKPDMLWISSPICLGDFGILHDKGVDPANCLACRESQQSGDIRGPEVRYAMNVLRYALRAGSWEMASPPSMTNVAWTFPGSRYDKILELQNITGQPAVGPGAAYDVLLGPCEDAGYQKYNIAHAKEVYWQQVPGAEAYIAELLKSRATDEQLRDLCGSVRNLSQIQQDIQQAKLLWSQARNAGQQPSGDVFGATFGGQDVAGQVNSLLGEARQDLFPGQAGQAVAFPTAAPVQPQAQPAAAANPFASMVPASALPAAPQPQAQPAAMGFPVLGDLAAGANGHPGGLAEFAAPADPYQQAAAQYQTVVDNAAFPTTPSAQPGPPAGSLAVPDSVLATPAPAAPAPTAQPGDMSLESLMAELG